MIGIIFRYLLASASINYAVCKSVFNKRSRILNLGFFDNILPVRFDESAVEGIPPTIKMISTSEFSPTDLGKLVLKKLGKTASATQ